LQRANYTGEGGEWERAKYRGEKNGDEGSVKKG